MGFKTSAFVLVLAVVYGAVMLKLPRRQDIPQHLKHHTLIDMGHGFLKDSTVDGLLKLTRSSGSIATAARDYDSYKTLADNIGEATPYNATASKSGCPSAFLMPNGPMTKCVFPGRIDVGKHFIMSGGIEAKKEVTEVLTARVQPFQKMLFNWSLYPEAKELMHDERFINLARDVCPAGRKHLDQFQFNLIVQVPGQTVAAHLDAPYFMYATRQTLPQWLLAAMVFSNLFQDQFVNQVQLVAYYHKWSDDRGGKFFFWNDDAAKPLLSDPVSGSANSVDGSKVVHAAGIYMPWRRPPAMPKDAKNELKYKGLDEARNVHRWVITQDGEEVQEYDEDELRFSAVYRARCFQDAAEKAQFDRQVAEEAWTPEYVLSVFEKDMKVKGTWPFAATETVLDRATPADRYTLGMAIMDQYVKYPWSDNAWLPVNYCALGTAVPMLKPLLGLVC